MERRGWGGPIAAIIIILILGGAALFGWTVYEKTKERTMPSLTYESLESYATNIGNALVNNRELEIPPEVLSTIIRELSGKEVACSLTAADRLKIWFRQEIKLLGETDIALELTVESFDQSTGELTLKIRDIYLGSQQVPAFLHGWAMDFAKGFASEKVSINGDQVRLVIDTLSTEVFGAQIEAGVSSVALRGGKLYFGLFADLNLDLGGLLDGIQAASGEPKNTDGNEGGEVSGNAVLDNLPQEIRDQIPDGALEAIPQELWDSLPADALEQFPENLPEEWKSLLQDYLQ